MKTVPTCIEILCRKTVLTLGVLTVSLLPLSNINAQSASPIGKTDYTHRT